MYSLLQRFFQNIFHSGQPALDGAADAAPSNALGCRNLGLAHAEKIMLVHTSGLYGRELGQRVIEGKGGFPCLNVLVRGQGLAGISGSFILVLLGKYFYIMEAVKTFNVPVMLVFIAGAAIGITTFSRVLSFALRKFHDITIAVLAGFMLGSLNKVWPWKETIETYVDSHGIDRKSTRLNSSHAT